MRVSRTVACELPLACRRLSVCVFAESCHRVGDASRGLAAVEVAVVESFLPCCNDAKWHAHLKGGGDKAAQTMNWALYTKEKIFF
jgi:hypothetical protein